MILILKRGPVTKLDKRNTATSKKIYGDAIVFVFVFFPIYGQFEATRRPDSGHMVYITYIFIKSNLLS